MIKMHVMQEMDLCIILQVFCGHSVSCMPYYWEAVEGLC